MGEIEEQDWNLAPGRYVGIAKVSTDTEEDFLTKMRALREELRRLNEEAYILDKQIDDDLTELLGMREWRSKDETPSIDACFLLSGSTTMRTNDLTFSVQRCCSLLRAAGIASGEYVEQLMYLLFLKMANERTYKPSHDPSHIPVGYHWQSLHELKSEELVAQYCTILHVLGNQPTGMLKRIFAKATNKIQDRC